jgi:hypothetical protein
MKKANYIFLDPVKYACLASVPLAGFNRVVVLLSSQLANKH